MTDTFTEKARTNFDQKTKEIGKIKCIKTCLWRQNSDEDSRTVVAERSHTVVDTSSWSGYSLLCVLKSVKIGNETPDMARFGESKWNQTQGYWPVNREYNLSIGGIKSLCDFSILLSFANISNYKGNYQWFYKI